MINELRREPSSFRDPAGYVIYDSMGSIYRSLDWESYQSASRFLHSPAYAPLLEQELIIPTELVRPGTINENVPNRYYLKHRKIGLVTYPYEWTAGMLLDAAECTLRVQLTLLEFGFSLKDASAFNIQFDFGTNGPAPVFIDIGSIEALTTATWVAYKQFTSHFLLPLLLYYDLGFDFKGTFLTDLDGFDPEQAYSLLGGRLKRFFPPYLTTVTLPHLLGRNGSENPAAAPKEESDKEKRLFIAQHLIRSLQKKIGRLRDKSPAQTEWQNYEEDNSYSDQAATEKAAFVENICLKIAPSTVLDIGCNAGRWDLKLMTVLGATVVGLDLDIPSLDTLYQEARYQKASILPLRIDITNPSPSIGWRNKERTSFLERIGESDCVFALAVVHHLMITKGIPLTEIASLLNDLTSDYLLVELIGPSDPMFRSLLRGREGYDGLTLEVQEEIFAGYFNILREKSLTGMDRTVYLMSKSRSIDLPQVY